MQGKGMPVRRARRTVIDQQSIRGAAPDGVNPIAVNNPAEFSGFRKNEERKRKVTDNLRYGNCNGVAATSEGSC